MVTPSRSCLHCALARALGDEAAALEAAGLSVTLGRSDPVWLPVRGAVLYRALRRLLRDARTDAARGAIRLTVVDLTGKSHVEVTAAVPSGRGARVLSRAFPRFELGLLGRGFAETANVR